MLINGAGGGSGCFAIQLAKRLGAHVTGVDNAAKQDFMLSMGADEVFAYRRALAPGGTYRCVGGSVRTLLRVLTVGRMLGRLSGRSIGVLAVKEGPAHFEPLAALCVAGEVRIHIDRTFALDEVHAALAHVGQGRALGKVVVAPS